MRALRKIEGKWVTETPEDFLRWMWKHDGEDAVVIDDERQEYSCGNETVRAGYAAKGKTALMFLDLGKRLLTEREGW
jgi:membrane-bound inhibitor of C-type lysozyme